MVLAVLLAAACAGGQTRPAPLVTDNRPELEPIRPSLGKEAIPADMPADVRWLVEQLYDEDQWACAAAAKALGDMGPAAVSAAPFLASLLDGHFAQPAPNCAAAALIRIGKGCFDAVAAAAGSTSEEARRRALLVMARLDGPRTVGPAMDMLPGEVRGDFCLGALRSIGEPAWDFVRRAGESPEPARRRAAMLALPAFSTISLRYRGLDGYGGGQPAVRLTQTVVDLLTKALGDRDEGVRLAAMRSLARMSGCRDKKMPLGETLRAALKDTKAEIRRAAVGVALAADETDAVKFDALAPLAADADPAVRRAAASAMEDLPEQRGQCVTLLTTMLKDGGDAAAARSALALGRMRAWEAEGQLLKAAEDPSPSVRAAAALALGRCGGKAGIEALMGMARKDDAWLSFQAALALCERWLDIRGARFDNSIAFRLTGSQEWEERSGLLPLPPSLRQPFPQDAVRGLMVEILDSPRHALHAVAATALIEGLPERDVPDSVLLAALNSPDKMAWWTALLHIEQFHLVPDQRFIEPLRRAVRMGGQWPAVDGMAVEVLGRMGDTETVVRHCERALKSKAPGGAVDTLLALGDPGLDLLLKCLSDPRPDVRETVVKALSARFSHARVQAFVRSALKSEDGRLRQAAEQVMAAARKETSPPLTPEAKLRAAMRNGGNGWRSHLGRVDTAAARMARDLLRDTDSGVRAAAAAILGEAGDASAAADLAKALADAAPAVRAQAVWSLGQLRDRTCVPRVLDMLRDGDEAVREAAAAALGALGDPATAGPLVQALDSPGWHLRRAAAQGLGAFGDANSTAALRKALSRDPHWSVRGAAAGALGRAAGASAAPALIAALDDGHWYVRQSAHAALAAATKQPLPPDSAAWRAWWQRRAEAQSRPADGGGRN